MRRVRAAVTAALVIASPFTGAAQQYRARVDASAQGVTFRGLMADSIAADQVVAGANGGLETPDGHAVRCGTSNYCFYFRPGASVHAVPLFASGSVILWGLGIEGLSVRATGRLTADAGRDNAWPGTEPAGQLLEGYAEYERGSLTVRGGRQLVASRLEAIGIDGGWLRSRWDAASVDVIAYAGWGLGRAAAVTASNPALNPLDEWRPRDRQHVAGAEAAWWSGDTDVRAEYRREIDPYDGGFVSERAALSLGARIDALRAVAGLDYNIAEGQLGSADVNLTYARPRYVATAGARRYRPFFSLWTLWGAFSPVPYNAVHGSVHVRATSRVSVMARAERYWYDDAEVSTALVSGLEDRGWRVSSGVTATLSDAITLDANYAAEFGPGAAGRFADAGLDYAPDARYSFGIYGGVLQRPLEFRFYDAESRWLGGRGEWNITERRRVWAEMSVVGDDRERPDAGGSSLSHVRLRTGLSLAFGSAADRAPLPPARRSRQ